MIPVKLKVSIENKCEAMVCPDCGGHHSVSVEVRGDTVCPRFLDASCEGFKDAVINLLKTEITRWINDPLPCLR